MLSCNSKSLPCLEPKGFDGIIFGWFLFLGDKMEWKHDDFMVMDLKWKGCLMMMVGMFWRVNAQSKLGVHWWQGFVVVDNCNKCNFGCGFQIGSNLVMGLFVDPIVVEWDGGLIEHLAHELLWAHHRTLIVRKVWMVMVEWMLWDECFVGGVGENEHFPQRDHWEVCLWEWWWIHLVETRLWNCFCRSFVEGCLKRRWCWVDFVVMSGLDESDKLVLVERRWHEFDQVCVSILV